MHKITQTRRRLIKEANGEYRVTYGHVREVSGLKKKACQKVMEQALRAKGVRFRAPRNKVFVSEEDAKKRRLQCEAWQRKSSEFWMDKVHAYVDNKSFPLPLTPKQRLRYRQTRITGHLRTAAEGLVRGFTKPRDSHCFVGFPSLAISAAVNKNRVIMWHVLKKTWNGASAAQMYKGPLLSALRRTHGKSQRYTIVEDGDRKGNESGKAKKDVNIRALTLPPRTPSLMPLDYAIWTEIEKRMDHSAPKGTESKAAFLKRLEQSKNVTSRLSSKDRTAHEVKHQGNCRRQGLASSE